MQLTGQQTLPVTQQQAWEALNDVSLLQAAIPGCEAITASGDNAKLAERHGVAPVAAAPRDSTGVWARSIAWLKKLFG